jgi:hypothetical protein
VGQARAQGGEAGCLEELTPGHAAGGMAGTALPGTHVCSRRGWFAVGFHQAASVAKALARVTPAHEKHEGIGEGSLPCWTGVPVSISKGDVLIAAAAGRPEFTV